MCSRICGYQANGFYADDRGVEDAHVEPRVDVGLIGRRQIERFDIDVLESVKRLQRSPSVSHGAHSQPGTGRRDLPGMATTLSNLMLYDNPSTPTTVEPVSTH